MGNGEMETVTNQSVGLVLWSAVSSIAGHKTSVGRGFSHGTLWSSGVQRLYDTYGLRRLTSRLLAQQGPTAGTAKNRRNGVGGRDDGGGPPLFLCSSRIELWREEKTEVEFDLVTVGFLSFCLSDQVFCFI